MRLVLKEEVPVSLTGGPSVKEVPKEDENNGYPTELNFERKSLSSVFMKNIMPTAEEVLQVAKAIKDENISAQLTAMLLGDPEWNS